MKHRKSVLNFALFLSFLLSGCSFDVAPRSDIYDFSIVAFNDFHGAIESDNRRLGLVQFGSYLKQASYDKNTLILSQGDDWQGSIYSNYNRGKLVNDVYSYCRVSARTVGNHDFDWGLDTIKENTAREYDEYKVPVLAANVYDYNFATKVEGQNQQYQIGVPTIKYQLKNGLKVGIVGIIGEDQITSITSSYTEEICFKEHISIIKQNALQLKEEGCDVVIATAHTGQDDLIGHGLPGFVDLVLCGHTHRKESYTEINLRYEQFGSYGQCIGNIKMQYNKKTKKVSHVETDTITVDNISSKLYAVDSHIQDLVNQYKSECDLEASEVVANNVSGSFYSTEQNANLMCRAMYDQCVLEGYNDVVLTYCNQGRASLYSRTWTYADIYQVFPFDNVVYVQSVKGQDILDEIALYNNVYISPSFNCRINANSYYKIGVIDYLLYHTNSNRDYNYFPSFDGKIDNQLSIGYRNILKNWLITNGYNSGKKLNSYDFSNDVSCHNNSRLVAA